ncbi:hydrogenase maturation protein [Streptomyces sp. AS58]|uniref:Hydrogenase maturation protein n=1 Tax=Streptomyces cadmiisoli TaxID=2184053 RepID=A0A2Z4ITG2_9ACTN|nr:MULTISPECIES: hydrogenase maturation protein [Streptomyces]AWW36135.1 hydrogenase maturation protein [Streptomyces cadmiisoli]KOV74538.1 hydrogenase maturation protein [Streptomyces sp. AS58]
MRILLIASAYNSLTQRVHAELRERGHAVAVEVTPGSDDVRAAVQRHRADLIVAPLLKAVVPREVWSARTCLIVHPGPVGDRGPSSLDWAIHEDVREWGVTVLQADEEMDAGPVWATARFPLPPVGKSDLYRNELSDAAVEAVLLAVERFASGRYVPVDQNSLPRRPHARTRPVLRQETRRISWAEDSTDTVLRALRAADSQPGVLDGLLGGEWFLHGGHPEHRLRGRPGELLATRAGAVCRATVDGAVWIPELRARTGPGVPRACKLPAVTALAGRLSGLPERPAPALTALTPMDDTAWSDIRYLEEGPVGILSFSFPGGAMSTDHCRRLLAAYRAARERPTEVLVLGGARDFFSNGIHLGVIEAAADPAAESWANINAMDDLVEAVLDTTDRLVVGAIGGNAAAGGVMLALAADEVWCRSGSVLNPHYRLMGLYGSEYWTYTLPRRVGRTTAERLTEDALPVTAARARDIGLVDRVVECAPSRFTDEVLLLAARLAASPLTRTRLAAKKTETDRRESDTPLAAVRERELARMRATFFDPDAPYHALRRAFARKERATAHRVAADAASVRLADS